MGSYLYGGISIPLQQVTLLHRRVEANALGASCPRLRRAPRLDAMYRPIVRHGWFGMVVDVAPFFRSFVSKCVNLSLLTCPHSMRSRVCMHTVWCPSFSVYPSVCLSHRSTAARGRSGKCEQCHVYSRRSRLDKDPGSRGGRIRQVSK